MEQFLIQRPDVGPAVGFSSSSMPLGNRRTVWIFDSGASHHMTFDKSIFSYITAPPQSLRIIAANGASMSLAGIGSVSSSHLSLPDVYFLPQLTMSLISVSQLCRSGCLVYFSDTRCFVQDRHTRKAVSIS